MFRELRIPIVSLACSFGLILHLDAYGQGSDFTLPDTVVTGDLEPFPAAPLSDQAVLAPTRTEAPQSRAPSSVKVISREQILRSGQTNVADVLRATAGLNVARQGGLGQQTSVFIRGGNSAHTKVMLDGIPLNDPTNPSRAFDFAHMTVDNIERIEVLRGSQSVLYGSDAIGGVVNIVTRRGDGPNTASATTMGGSFGTFRQSVGASGGGRNGYYSVSSTHVRSDGISAVNAPGATELDGYKNTTTAGRFGWTPSTALGFDYVFRYTDAQSELDDFGADNPIRELHSRNFYQRFQLQSLLLDGALEQKVGFNWTNYHRRDTDPGAFGTPEFDGQARQVDWQVNLLLTESNQISAGVEYLQEEAEQTSSTSRLQDQHNLGVFVQDQWQVGDRLLLVVGARRDDYSQAGQADTYRAAGSYLLPELGGRFHGMVGTGFRAPSIAELFFPFGNSQLRPEKSKSWELGWEHTFGGGQLVVDASYFNNKFDNLIIFDVGTFALGNVAQARTSGVELEARWQVTPVLQALAHYTYLDGRNLTANETLARRPENQGGVSLTRTLLGGRADLGASVLYVGERLDFSGGPMLEDYVKVDFTGNYHLTSNARLFARLDNAFDEDYEEAGGFSTPGIAAYGGIRVSY